MKKRTKVVLGIILILIVGVASVAIWQRNNIEAVLMRTKYSSKELTTQIEKQDEVIAQAIDKLPGSFHVLTKEQEDALKNGQMTEQEAIDIMTGNAGTSNVTNSNEASSSPKNDSNTTQAPKDTTKVKSEQEKEIDKLVAQIYVLRSSFMSKLESLMQSAKNDFNASSEPDKTKVKKQILLKYASQASSLESQCDAEVNKILSKLESLLKETGGDVSIVNDIRNAYYNEKSLKKAYYISQYT